VCRVLVPDEELPAANVLAVAGRCFIAAGHPRTAELLREQAETVIELELDEFTKADGGPTCLVAILPG
jgi:N-dimethylarginine dimethylaminohydrolase